MTLVADMLEVQASSIDAGYHLVSKKSLSQNFGPLDWRPGPIKVGQKNKNTTTLQAPPRRNPYRNQKKFFFNRTKKTCHIRRGFEQLSNYSGWRVTTKKLPAHVLARAKNFISSKTNTGPRRKDGWSRHKSDTKNTRKKRNAASNVCWQFVQGPCHIMFENCTCSWNRSSWRSDLKMCLFSDHFPFFITHSDCLSKWWNLFTKIPANQRQLFKTNAIGYQTHLTIENNLKVEIKVIIWKTSTSLPYKITLGVRAQA